MAFKALNILLLRKCDTLSMLLGSIIVTDENKQLFWDPRYQYNYGG